MQDLIHSAVFVCLAVLFAVGAYHRIVSQMSGDRLDRSKEGWPLMIGIRSLGLAGLVQTVLIFMRPPALDWARLPLPLAVRWFGVATLAASIAWLCWMFFSLGRNLTDTVVTRRDATFVKRGPYHFVRNPMYTGLLIMGLGIGLALENVSIPATFLAVFVLLAIRTRTEEKYLIARFGDAYLAYMRRVGRFLPSLRPGR